MWTALFKAVFWAILMVSFFLLLHQYALKTNENQSIGFAVSSVHLHRCCCLELFRRKTIVGNTFNPVFCQQRGRPAFSLASNVRNPCCTIWGSLSLLIASWSLTVHQEAVTGEQALSFSGLGFIAAEPSWVTWNHYPRLLYSSENGKQPASRPVNGERQSAWV